MFETSRAGFNLSLDVSAYSLIALANTFRESFNDGASIVALTYLGSTQIVPNYNLMGISKAALEAVVRYLAFDLGIAASASTRFRPAEFDREFATGRRIFEHTRRGSKGRAVAP